MGKEDFAVRIAVYFPNEVWGGFDDVCVCARVLMCVLHSPSPLKVLWIEVEFCCIFVSLSRDKTRILLCMF